MIALLLAAALAAPTPLVAEPEDAEAVIAGLSEAGVARVVVQACTEPGLVLDEWSPWSRAQALAARLADAGIVATAELGRRDACGDLVGVRVVAADGA